MKTTATTQKQRSKIASAVLVSLFGIAFTSFIFFYNWQKENLYSSYPEFALHEQQLLSDSGIYLVDKNTKTRYAIAADISKGKRSYILFSVTDSLGNKAVFIDQHLNSTVDEVSIGTWTAVGSFTQGAGFWSPDVKTIEKKKIRAQHERLQTYFNIIKMKAEDLLRDSEGKTSEQDEKEDRTMQAIEDLVFGVKVRERHK